MKSKRSLFLCVQNLASVHFGFWSLLEIESTSGLCPEGDFSGCNVLAVSIQSGFLTVKIAETIYKISILSSVSHFNFESLDSNQII